VNGTRDPFLKPIKEFVAADILLFGQLERFENDAAVDYEALSQRSEAAKRIVNAYGKQIQNGSADRTDLPTDSIPTLLKEQLESLKNTVVELQAMRRNLDQLNIQIENLRTELQKALLREKDESLLREQKAKAERRKQIIVRSAIAFTAVSLVVAAHVALLNRTTLSFSVTVDGKPLSLSESPVATLDEQPFASAEKIRIGRHKLSISLPNAESLQRQFWTFYGTNNLGNLNLESSKGSLHISVEPLPALVRLEQNGQVFHRTNAPLILEALPVGDYMAIVRREDYEERLPLKIQRHEARETHIKLKIGTAQLSSEPPDAEYELSGHGKLWRGKVPVRLENIPAGTFVFSAMRQGRAIQREISIKAGELTSEQLQFPYGSIEVDSLPSGLAVSVGGTPRGTTPETLQQIMPGSYTLTATDGENNLSVTVSVHEKEVTKHTFIFKYGTVQLSSIPPGALVIRNSASAGTTPAVLQHIPTEPIQIELKLDGYVSTNLVISAPENAEAKYAIKLINLKYLNVIRGAERELAARNFERALELAEAAVALESTDSRAGSLKKEISDQVEIARQEQLDKERRDEEAKMKALATELSSFQLLVPDDIIRTCRTKSAKNFSPLIVSEKARDQPLDVPFLAAEDVVIKGIELFAWPIRKATSKREPKLDPARFNMFQNHDYRYFGRIAAVDFSTKILTFSVGGTAKDPYVVSLRLSDATLPPKLTIKPGALVWISGRLSNIVQTIETAAAPIQFILDDGTLYPPELLNGLR